MRWPRACIRKESLITVILILSRCKICTWMCNFSSAYFKVCLHSVAPKTDCFTMGLVNIFYPLKWHFHGLKESAADRSEKEGNTLLKWKNSLEERVPVSLSWERSQLSFLWMPLCYPLKQCCVVRVLPKSLFSLDLATVSVCPTRSCLHFFKLHRKLIKYIHL